MLNVRRFVTATGFFNQKPNQGIRGTRKRRRGGEEERERERERDHFTDDLTGVRRSGSKRERRRRRKTRTDCVSEIFTLLSIEPLLLLVV